LSEPLNINDTRPFIAVFQWSTIAIYSIVDGVALQLAKEHNGNYAEIYQFSMIAQVLCSVVPPLIISHANSATGGAPKHLKYDPISKFHLFRK
jgi:hypothetical protein